MAPNEGPRSEKEEFVMRKVLISIAMLSATMAAIPASAQAWRIQPQVQREIQGDINQLQNQIQRAQQRRTISQREAIGLRRDATNLQRTYNNYLRGGLNRTEVAALQTQVNRIHLRLKLERRDWDGRRG
jgi:sensor domain CHASE-containing protein